MGEFILLPKGASHVCPLAQIHQPSIHITNLLACLSAAIQSTSRSSLEYQRPKSSFLLASSSTLNTLWVNTQYASLQHPISSFSLAQKHRERGSVNVIPKRTLFLGIHLFITYASSSALCSLPQQYNLDRKGWLIWPRVVDSKPSTCPQTAVWTYHLHIHVIWNSKRHPCLSLTYPTVS